MATYIVTRVRKVLAADATHRHIDGVCTADGTYHTRGAVITSIGAGHTWKTRDADGDEAEIEVISYCPQRYCLVSPYIRTHPDRSEQDNLEDLEEC